MARSTGPKRKLERRENTSLFGTEKWNKRAAASTGNTDLILLQFLELRLDNVLYRLGFGKTRMQSRQIVNHGHVLVNGKKLDIPSYRCSVGDEIELSPKFQKSELVKLLKTEIISPDVPNWLNKTSYGGKLIEEPSRDQIDQGINEQLIIELYSR